jgi:inner membrane protein
MDTLTHALSGALLARAAQPKDAPARSLPRRIAAGFFACAAPDLDIVYAFGGPAAYLENHRAASHSLLMLPLWAALVAWLLAKVLREAGGWRALYGVCAMSIGLHIAGDLITGYGTQVLWPLTDWRPGLGITFVIDPWFSGIIVAGLVGSVFLTTRKFPAIASFAALLAYIGFQGVLKERALALGEQYVREHALHGADVRAFPRPVSPFNWTVLVSDDELHYFSHVNLLRTQPRPYRPGDGFLARIDSPYLPVAQQVWVTRKRFGETDQALIREAWDAAPLAFFRWFAELPAFEAMSAGSTCVWFTDLRFLTPGRGERAFVFGVCRERLDAPWRAYERIGDTDKIPVR